MKPRRTTPERTQPRLRLYVAGAARNSVVAAANLRVITRQLGSIDVETVDVLEKPEQALRDGIVVTPTLVYLAPGPQLVIVGDLDEHDQVLNALTGRLAAAGEPDAQRS